MNSHYYRLTSLLLFFMVQWTSLTAQEVLACQVDTLADLGQIHGFGFDKENQAFIYAHDGLYRGREFVQQQEIELLFCPPNYAISQTCRDEANRRIILAYQAKTTPFHNKIIGHRLTSSGEISNIDFTVDFEDIVITKILFNDQEKRLYVATLIGLYYIQIDFNRNFYTRRDFQDVIPNREVYDMYLDADSNLWIAARVGLYKKTANRLFFSKYSKGIRAIVAKGDYIYAAGHGALFTCRFDQKPSAKVNVDLGGEGRLMSLLNDPVRDMAIDRNNNLWLASNAIGCFNLDQPLKQFYVNNNVFSSNFFTKIEVDKYNNLLIAAANSKLFYLHNCTDTLAREQPAMEIAVANQLSNELSVAEFADISSAPLDTLIGFRFSLAERLLVSESGTEDGDRISVVFNNHWLLQDEQITTEKRILDLLPYWRTENNQLIIWAEDDGRDAGVTVKLQLKDQVQSIRLPLGSYQLILLENIRP